MKKRRILLAITVYNGREFVPDTIASALRVAAFESELVDVDVAIFDDASPDTEWSAELERLAANCGAHYYRTPRNLGIPRNCALAMRVALRLGYDYIVISNSDVLYPQQLLDQMTRVYESDPRIGSLTAWSNNVSVYSLPNADEEQLKDQAFIDWISASLAGQYGTNTIDIPSGISFCILISADVVRRVGVMDPIFGRGYCEEVDWTLRSQALGYRIALCPSVFVFHRGGGSNVAAGLLASGETTVPANERILDLRYPDFRARVRNFMASGVLDEAREGATRRIILDAARQFGYNFVYSWLPRDGTYEGLPNCTVSADESGAVARWDFRGFHSLEDVAVGPSASHRSAIAAAVGRDPSSSRYFRNSLAGRVFDADPDGVSIVAYPEPVART